MLGDFSFNIDDDVLRNVPQNWVFWAVYKRALSEKGNYIQILHYLLIHKQVKHWINSNACNTACVNTNFCNLIQPGFRIGTSIIKHDICLLKLHKHKFLSTNATFWRMWAKHKYVPILSHIILNPFKIKHYMCVNYVYLMMWMIFEQTLNKVLSICASSHVF